MRSMEESDNYKQKEEKNDRITIGYLLKLADKI